MDSPKDVTVQEFLDDLCDALAHIDVVQPADLREPLSLWLRATEERALRDGWTHLLGRSVTAEWNATRAILRAARE
ncbi:hypothetical protein GCM10022243_48330 [Saccharothrix violaceirubra]|uniref:Uncharacterized protein n=1 Tax=Saccharothrix violaceirubra TaxID=413306 RepID=A0A7W7T1W7_9PSEU|nr:hypothetical protein [Saccharothrix violaceirubra]MBB4963825.1 hypothetical protein [Saccharothrix violaceirubra]